MGGIGRWNACLLLPGHVNGMTNKNNNQFSCTVQIKYRQMCSKHAARDDLNDRLTCRNSSSKDSYQ